MAELNYDQMAEGPGLELPRVGHLINILGAVISVGLIVGLAWWGYQLVVRDVSGVPVVRALEGPMRVAPADPGGEVAEHVGLAVNSIPAEGIAEEPAERIILAPVTTNLSEEDLTQDQLAKQVEAEEIAAMEPAEAIAAQEETMDDLIGAALAEATGTVAADDGTVLELVSADVPGVVRSLIPMPRPSTMAAPAPLPVADDGVVTLDVGQIAEGTRLAQLGAFDSEAEALMAWGKLAAQFPEYMTDKARVIEAAQSGGKMFYRLRAHGFEDLNDSRRFCAALVGAGENCISVRQR